MRQSIDVGVVTPDKLQVEEMGYIKSIFTGQMLSIWFLLVAFVTENFLVRLSLCRNSLPISSILGIFQRLTRYFLSFFLAI